MVRDTADRRVRRSSDFDDVLDQIVGKDKPFMAMRDALLFAACLGFSKERRVKLNKNQSEPIRWDVMTNRNGCETAVNLIAVLCNEDDPEILSESRFDERITMFEEYASGGLEIIKNLINASPKQVREVLLQLIDESLPKTSPEKASDITGAVDAIFR